MALSTLFLAAVLLGAYALYKYWDTSRRHRIPKGLKPLPGPKGTALSFIGRSFFLLLTLSSNSEVY
jgi:hypothetical protein